MLPFKKNSAGDHDGRWLPYPFKLPPGTWERIVEHGRLFHDEKNFAVEFFRAAFEADAQYWAKCVCNIFIILLISFFLALYF